MGGTREGGRKARDRMIERYGSDYFARIGEKGGTKGHTGGFYHMRIHDPKRLSEIGRYGGKKNRKPESDVRVDGV